MNDEQLIWEAYQKQLKENIESNPWDPKYLRLKSGIRLTSLSPEILEEYLAQLWNKMSKEAQNQTGGFIPPDDPREWVDPPEADESHLDEYFKSKYGFTLEELKSLSNAPQFTEEGSENWPEQIMDLAVDIVQHEMYVGDDSPSPDQEGRLRGRF